MFGGPSFGFAPRGPRKAQDAIIPYKVTLEDLYNGKTAHFALEKNVVCSHCNGHGGKRGMSPKDCVTCGGKGRVLHQRQAGSGLIQQSLATCSDCGGEGKKFREKDAYVPLSYDTDAQLQKVQGQKGRRWQGAPAARDSARRAPRPAHCVRGRGRSTGTSAPCFF